MDMTDEQRTILGGMVEAARRSRYGSKSAAYTRAGVNAATWDRIESGQPVREDRPVAAINLLWPEADGNWVNVLHPPSAFGRGRRTVPAADTFETWVENELGRLSDRVDLLEQQLLEKEVGDDSAATIAAYPMKGSESQGRQARKRQDDETESP